MLDGHNDVLLRLYRRSGIAKHRYTRHAGRNLLEQFHPLSAHAVFEIREPGGIASRPRQAFDQAGTDRVGNIHEHERDPPLPRVGESERRRRMGLQLHRVMVDANARDLRRLLRVRAVSAIEKA
jgi:hypothetical protein